MKAIIHLLNHWLFEQLIAVVLGIVMMAGFLVVLAPLALGEVAKSPPSDRWQSCLLIGIPTVATNAITAFGFLYVKRARPEWRRYKLSRGIWIFLLALAYVTGLAMAIGGLVTIYSP